MHTERMRIFKAEEMSCEHCVSRIQNALTEAGITHKIDLSEKTVAIEGDENIVAEAVELLDDLGFSAEEIV